ncbi:hypothetical protein B0J13DRAFT_560762 [Dactylonectria estremocensis]|uniref:Uncharacterized protein n=1 Tax=Dactylonectria estremocensis TaxID=1079267 RepID=A0A9P9EBT7_9HYPO|nr:hypothetical protein B0J13DRAFT_560762 [Dactylonectria estremocensis]
MSRLRKIIPILSLGSSPSSPSSITSAPDLAWSLVGSGGEHLLVELEGLYWDGVKAELENIVRTLKIWQQPEYSDVTVEEEEDEHLHGFDTFLNQVSQEARAFAIRYGNMREREEKKKREPYEYYTHTYPTHMTALKDSVADHIAEHSTSKTKAAVRKSIKAVPRLKGMEHRAWTLLQAAGFLDIEKLVEHRPPLGKFGFWKRPAIPQLALSKFDDDYIPRFEPLHCTRPQCKAAIRGSMFVNQDEPAVVCEDCYRNHYYGKESFLKAYKHCVLAECITPDVSRSICHCKDVPHFDGQGRALSLYPVDRSANHVDSEGIGSIKCSLLKLGEVIALAKYDGLQTVVGIKKPSKHHKAEGRSASETGKSKHKFGIKPEAEGPRKVSSWKPKQMRTVEGTTLHGEDRSPASSSTSVATEALADEDIPMFFRKFTEKYPFGNVHMALRVGPLVIENGVSHTKSGALVSLREMPIFHERFPLHSTPERNYAVDGSADRTLWQRKRQSESRKRYKAIMKQVVGAPFSGVLVQDKELEVVRDVLAACKQPFEDPGLPASDQIKLLDSALGPALDKLKALLGKRVRLYLESISKRLLDPDTKLTWSATGNNCQAFCNSIIDRNLFEPLVNGTMYKEDPEAYPLYSMSFVCPDEGYRQRGVRTKYDVPSGLTEEYLLRFHFGRHDEADIIDTYQEYWHDWGAFGGTLYRNQDLFPWDCTEAYGRYPTRCGDCNLAKHIWAFPFDSWSMASLHLARDRHMYAPATVDQAISAVGTNASPSSWMRNRLTVLSATSILHRVAAAMALTREVRRDTAWLHMISTRPDLDPSLIRVKLGGIHRAQPFSHYFEAGTYSHYFLAPWATWSRPEQTEAYELMRDGRVKLPDVPYASWSERFASSGGGTESSYGGFGGTDVGGTNGAVDAAAMSFAMASFSDSQFSPVEVSPADADGNCAGGCGSADCGGADCGGDDGDGDGGGDGGGGDGGGGDGGGGDGGGGGGDGGGCGGCGGCGG